MLPHPTATFHWKRWRAHQLLLLSLIMSMLVQGANSRVASAQPIGGYIHLVRLMERSRVQLNGPTAIAYIPSDGHFLLTGMPLAGGGESATVTAISPYEDQLATEGVPAEYATQLLAYDVGRQHLILLNRSTHTLEAVALRADGMPDWASRAAFMQVAKDEQLQGATVTPEGSLLLLTDGVNGTSTLRQLRLSDTQESTTAPSAGELTSLATTPRAQANRQSSLHGLALHPQSDHLFTVDTTNTQLLEFTAAGQFVNFYDLAPFALGNIQALVFAPSADQTDDPTQQSLYLVAQLNAQDNGKPNGQVAEFTFVQPPAPTAVAEDVATLVRTVNTFEYTPPSPDPAGIAYIPPNPYVNTSDRLLISDSEVDEMKLYDGANFFETTRNGVLQVTHTSYPTITAEPAGLTFNPNNGHLLITDDDNIRPLIEVSPGPDKVFLSADDTWTKVSLRDSPLYGNQDPEGVEYARINGEDYLFILDGLNSEFYVTHPGASGVFNGTDDVVVHYDTLSKGVSDPEGIAYHPATGTIYIVGAPTTRVAEFSITGELIRYVDISAANADKPAGLAFGPGSNNQNEIHLYIVDRGVDNDSDSKENDGLMYEFAIPTGANRPPVVDAGDPITVNWPAAAALSATITDDGLPKPSTLTTEWSKVSGPGSVSFDDAGAINTTATFSAPGTYSLQLAASDGELTGAATLVVTAEANNLPPVIEVGADQTLELSEQITVTAQTSDDGLPLDPGTVTVTWTQLSGPGDATFGDENNAVTTVSFNEVGSYLLRATATDGDLSSSDDLTVTVAPDNEPPLVDAGPDQRIGLGDTTTLQGTVTDDGLPDPPAALTMEWRKQSGQGAVSFSNTNALSTTVSFTARGSYELELRVSDGKLTVSDYLTIVVDLPNQPPVVDAGPNMRTTLTDVVTLVGKVSDDGIPNPPGSVTVEWSQLSGPGTITFSNSTAVSTTASADARGIYVLQLEANDGSLHAADTMTLNVGEENKAPIFDIIVGGTSITTTGTTITLQATAHDDYIPAPSGLLAYHWQLLSGPADVTFGSPTQSETLVTFRADGSYAIRIIASDGDLESTLDFMVIVAAPNYPPVIEMTTSFTLRAPGILQLTPRVTDDGKPDSPHALTYQWQMTSGPEPVIFGNPTAQNTSAQFVAPGLYQLTLTVSDGALDASTDISVTVGDNPVYSTYLPIIR